MNTKLILVQYDVIPNDNNIELNSYLALFYPPPTLHIETVMYSCNAASSSLINIAQGTKNWTRKKIISYYEMKTYFILDFSLDSDMIIFYYL